MTIVNRNGRYGAKKWNRGTKKYDWLGSFDTLEEAEQAISDASLKDRKTSPTVAQWSRVWLSDYARPAAATRRNYRYAVKAIVESLGGFKLSEITRVQARQQASQWPRGTVKVAASMWADAKRDEVCDLNPWENLRLSVQKGRKDLTALTESEVSELAEIAREQHGEWGLEAKAIVLTLAYTGMRPGELFALKRTDADLEAGTLRVKDNIDATGAVKPPKNELGRLVVLPEIACEAIREMPQQLSSERLFHSRRGKTLKKTNFTDAWKDIAAVWLSRHGKNLRPYELRHAAATAMIERGLSPADVAFQLGHKDGGRLVMALYGHPAEGSMRDRIRLAWSAEPSEMRRTG